MDNKNLFETPVTFSLHRTEYGVMLMICFALLVANFSDVRWVAFAAAFLYIDVIGYLPGGLAYRLSKDGNISKIFYVLYNTMHSLITASLVLVVWYFISGLEWAMLAIPIHLFGDRSVFGNFLKPFNVSFEPIQHPAFKSFQFSYKNQNSI